MSKHNMKLENYGRALVKLQEGLQKYDGKDDLFRDGIIQRFEFTFELAWKALKAIFEREGLIGLNTPKTILREALSAGLISDEEIWLAMLKDRNSTVHIYSEKMAAEICDRIQNKYIDQLEKLFSMMVQRDKNN